MKCTEFAAAYVVSRRKAVLRRGETSATWDHVAAAYDDGLRHALAVSPSQRQHLLQLFKVLVAANREVSKS
jgi:hypothetical protein